MAKKKDDIAPKKPGRPHEFTSEIAMEFCMAVACSMKGIHWICRENENFPDASTIYRWLLDKTKVVKHKYEDGEEVEEAFCETYARAKELQAEFMKDEIIKAAWDDSEDTIEWMDPISGNLKKAENKEWINRSRLKVDSLKWLMAKLAPVKYSDAVKVMGDKDNPVEQVVTVSFKKRKPDEQENGTDD